MSRAARVYSALTAVVVLVALAIQIPITAATEGGAFTTPAARVANLFTYFTIQTNLLVAGVGIALAAGWDGRSTLFRTLRLDALLGITITGVVHRLLLAGLVELSPGEAVADLLFHTVSPVLAVVGWLLFGPRGTLDRRVIALSVVYPLAWLALTLVRGALIGWYPYPFLDVAALGYPTVALNSLGITALFLLLAIAATAVDRVLGRRSGRAVTVGR